MIWVIAEKRGESVSPVAYQALGAGAILSEALDTGTNLVIFGAGLEGPAQTLAKKADRIYLLEHRFPGGYTDGGFVKALKDFLKDKDVTAIIIPAASSGKDLAPLLSVSLGISYIANANRLEVKDKTVFIDRPLCGGRVMERLSLSGRPAIISIMPRAFKEPPDKTKPADVFKAELTLKEDDLMVRVKEAGGTISEVKDIVGADIIVSGGRGLNGKENFRLLDTLASALGGMVAASRGAVDSGWIEQGRQVGQTGKTVSPKLYIACGISGAPQHIAGMRTSEFVMAINKDPNAPIFKEADLGITGDLFEVIPELVKEIKRVRQA